VHTLRRVKLLLTRSSRKFADDKAGLLAAAIAYWAIFSVFPLLLLLVGFFGLVLDGSELQGRVIDEVLKALPFSEDKGREEVTKAVEGISGARGGVFGVLGLAVAAWSGSNMFGAIRRSLNSVFGYEEGSSLAKEKLRDLAMVAGLAPFFLSSIMVTALLQLAQTTSEELPLIGGSVRVLGPGWDLLSVCVPMVISFAAFSALFVLAPARRNSLRRAWPGALVAAILFEFAKFGFTIYLESVATHEVVYGSLGVMVAFFLWVYLTSSILLFGAEVVCEYPGSSSTRFDRNQE
jgi:membrane protein